MNGDTMRFACFFDFLRLFSNRIEEEVMDKQYTYAEAAGVLRVAERTLRRWGLERTRALPPSWPAGALPGSRPHGGLEAIARHHSRAAGTSCGSKAAPITPPGL